MRPIRTKHGTRRTRGKPRTPPPRRAGEYANHAGAPIPPMLRSEGQKNQIRYTGAHGINLSRRNSVRKPHKFISESRTPPHFPQVYGFFFELNEIASVWTTHTHKRWPVFSLVTIDVSLDAGRFFRPDLVTGFLKR